MPELSQGQFQAEIIGVELLEGAVLPVTAPATHNRPQPRVIVAAEWEQLLSPVFLRWCVFFYIAVCRRRFLHERIKQGKGVVGQSIRKRASTDIVQDKLRLMLCRLKVMLDHHQTVRRPRAVHAVFGNCHAQGFGQQIAVDGHFAHRMPNDKNLAGLQAVIFAQARLEPWRNQPVQA